MSLKVFYIFNSYLSTTIMRQLLGIIFTLILSLSFGQVKRINGTYSSLYPKVYVTFNQDSTFEYDTKEQHPTFYEPGYFSEKGNWTIKGDTIILNPNLTKKVFVEADFRTGIQERYKLFIDVQPYKAVL